MEITFIFQMDKSLNKIKIKLEPKINPQNINFEDFSIRVLSVNIENNKIFIKYVEDSSFTFYDYFNSISKIDLDENSFDLCYSITNINSIEIKKSTFNNIKVNNQVVFYSATSETYLEPIVEFIF